MKPCLRYTKSERQARQQAQAVLDSPDATSKDKERATRTLKQVEKSARDRTVEKETIRAIGKPPERKNFTSDVEFEGAKEIYRLRLDELRCQRILDNPTSKPYQCKIARQRLADIHRQIPRAPRALPTTQGSKADAKPELSFEDVMQGWTPEPLERQVKVPEPIMEPPTPEPSPQPPKPAKREILSWYVNGVGWFTPRQEWRAGEEHLGTC